MILPENTRERIIEERRKRGLSQSALARLAGVSQASVSSMETGTTGVSERNLNAMITQLGLETEIKEALRTMQPPGEWLTPGQVAHSKRTSEMSVIQMAQQGRTPEARNTEDGNWWILATYHMEDPRRLVIIDALTGLGNQYTVQANQDPENQHTREFFLHEGIAVFHIEKGDAQKYKLQMERQEEESWQEVWAEELDQHSEAAISMDQTERPRHA